MRSSHKIPIGHHGWSLWHWVFLRGAGFNAKQMEKLRPDNISSYLEELSVAESVVAQAVENAVNICRDRLSEADEDLARKLQSALTRLESGTRFKWRFEDTEIDDALDDLQSANQALSEGRERCTEFLLLQHELVAEALKIVASDSLFQEALTWQNREALRNTVLGFLRGNTKSNNAKTRERKRVISKYLQRYCLKNDTIGFFGPVGWSEISKDNSESTWTEGPLVVKREVKFEPWALNIVASQLSMRDELAPYWLARRKPTTWLEGDVLYSPMAPPVSLSPAEATLLRLADGSLTAKQIVEKAMEISDSGIENTQTGLELLASLKKVGQLLCSVEIPPQLEHPEFWLRDLLESIDDPTLRESALEPINRLIEGRDKLTESAGDTERLGKAIQEFEDTFKAVTGIDSKRGHGKTYAGRQIFFEDCLRGGDLQIGSALVDDLGLPLSLILESARWFSYQLGGRYRKAFTKTYQLLKKTHGDDVPVSVFLGKINSHFSPDQYSMSSIVKEVQIELQRRWAIVLGLKEDGQSMECQPEYLVEQVASAFDAPGPGWPRAKFHSPDIMIAAPSLDAINSGDYQAVLGEVHTSTNTLFSQVAYFLHPDKESLVRAYDEDIDTTCIGLMQQKASRATHPARSRKEFEVEFGTGYSWMDRDHVVPVGDLVVREHSDKGLTVEHRTDENIRCDILNFMDRFLTADSAPHFEIVRKKSHQPRVTIGKLVVSRERWSFNRNDFGFLSESSSAEDWFLRVATWRNKHKLPSRVFATVSTEPKPFYVDFESPVLVDVFVRYLSKTPKLTISEMLPDLGDQWLPGENQELFTSELRVVAVDYKKN